MVQQELRQELRLEVRQELRADLAAVLRRELADGAARVDAGGVWPMMQRRPTAPTLTRQPHNTQPSRSAHAKQRPAGIPDGGFVVCVGWAPSLPPLFFK